MEVLVSVVMKVFSRGVDGVFLNGVKLLKNVKICDSNILTRHVLEFKVLLLPVKDPKYDTNLSYSNYKRESSLLDVRS